MSTTGKRMWAVVAAAALVGLAEHARAATYYWDGTSADIATNGTGFSNPTANGVWNTTIKNWDQGDALAHIAWPDLSTDTAEFAGVGRIVTVSPVNVNTINLRSSSSFYTFNGGTITFPTGGIIDTFNSGSSILNSALVGPVKVQATGSGANLGSAMQVTIAGANTGLTGFEMSMNTVNNPICIDHASALGPAGTPVKLTKGVLNLGNTDTAKSFNAWALELAGGTIRSRFNSNTVNAATTLTADSGLLTRGVSTVALTFSSSATVNLNNHTLLLTAANQSSGIYLDGVVSGTGNVTLGNFTGGVGLVITGTNYLGAANTFSGTATTPQDYGLLALNHTQALQNATLDTGTSGTQAVLFVVSGNNTYHIGALTGSDALEIGGNTLSVGSKAANTTFSAAVNGTGGGLTKVGSSTLTLSGNSGFTGATLVNGGLLVVAHNNALGTTAGDTTVNGGYALKLANGMVVSGETIKIAASGGDATVGNYNGALQADAGATAEWAGTVQLNSTDARVGAGIGGSLRISGAIVDGVGTTLNVGAGYGGSGEVIVAAAPGANTYSGNTTVTRGTLKLGADNTLPTGTILDVDVANAGEISIFDLNGYNQTVGGLQRTNAGGGAGTSRITNSGLTDKTLTINQAVDTTFSGTIQDGASKVLIAKDGVGTLALSAANTYSGATTVGAGTLALSGAGSIAGSSIINIAAGATVDVSAVTGGSYTNGAGQTLKGNGVVAGNLVMGGASILAPGNSTGTNFFTGALTLSGNTNEFELAGAADYDQSVVTGASLTLANTPILALNLGGYTSAENDVFTLFDNAPGTTVTGAFWLDGSTELTDDAVFSATGLSVGHQFQIDYNGGTGNDITLTVVPEPGTVGLIGLIGLAAVLRRRLRG